MPRLNTVHTFYRNLINMNQMHRLAIKRKTA